MNKRSNGTSDEKDTYIVKVERLEADGETTTPVCEGGIVVPEKEDTIALDDLIEAIKVHDLWEDGGEGWDEDSIQ